MKVNVTKEKVIITETTTVLSGEVGINECEFSLPECFATLNVTAVFNNIPVPLVNGKCIIPSLEEGTAILGVYAYNSSDDNIELMYSPQPTLFYVAKGSYPCEENEQVKPDISLYEQYCNMLKAEFNSLSHTFTQSETLRENAENERKNTFKENELQRENTFAFNETKRNSASFGSYTNLLSGLTQSDDDSVPSSYPCKKNGYFFNKEICGFLSNSVTDSYIFEANPGDSFNVSGFEPQTETGYVCFVVNEKYETLLGASILNSRDALGGTYVMPEGTRYVILNAVKDSSTPFITKVAENVIETNDNNVPCASKFISPQKNGKYHLCYDGEVGSTLLSSWALSSTIYYTNGLYPLKQGEEYVVSMPQVNDGGYYYKLLIFCDKNLKINKIVNHQVSTPSFDEKGEFVFTPSENDCYVAINCLDFGTGFQFGENRAKNISKAVNIGNAKFDGMHNLSLKDMGIIDRSVNKKFIAYGDSITLGVGVDYVNGEKRWTDYIVDRYNVSEHINMGVGYSSLAMREIYSETPMSHDDRLNILINEAPDIVTIFGGANDYIFNIPIGTDEDVINKNRYTFKGAYAYIIDKILSAKPDTTIILLGMFHNTMGSYAEGKGKYPLKNYSIATREIAEVYGLPFVDLNECGFNKYNFNTTKGVFSTDGIHPNAEGTKRIAMVLSKWFDAFNGTIC